VSEQNNNIKAIDFTVGTGNSDPYGVYYMALIRRAALEKKMLFTKEVHGYLGEAPGIFEEFLKRHPLQMIYRDLPGRRVISWDDDVEHAGPHSVYVSEDTCVTASFKKGGVNIGCYSFDYAVVESLSEMFSEVKATQETGGVLHVLVRDGQGNLEVKRGATVGEKLQRVNYNDEVLQAYDTVVQSYNSKIPHGRLVILDGLPGTGKTFMVRSFIQEIKGTFVLVQAETIAHMDGPDFLNVMLELREDTNEPIFFIIEDADDCLVERERDNMSAVRSLLNYSDGLLGAALDVRIIATTNAKRAEFDSALQREGRLLQHMHVGSLDASKAQQVFEELAGKETGHRFTDQATLAAVYYAAREHGWKPAGHENEPSDLVTAGRSVPFKKFVKELKMGF
jgi:hypothetical protein